MHASTSQTAVPPVRRKHHGKKKLDAFFTLIDLIFAGILILSIAVLATRPDNRVIPREEWMPKDTQAPEILGIQDRTVYQGQSIAYREGVTVTDGEDPAPVLTIDSSQVDLTTPGTYQVTYTASDASGNTQSLSANVTVLEKKEWFVDWETIDAAADAKLQELGIQHQPPESQIRAIYTWARTNLAYGGHSDRTDWRQTAYQMLTNGQGDCFGYFAVTKLLLERLGIPNIDVQKVKNAPEDSDHFWSLVSIDGGSSYYHLDTTPRTGEGDAFCLVTDSFLDAYSEAHKFSHNRDKSLYPATPEEAL